MAFGALDITILQSIHVTPYILTSFIPTQLQALSLTQIAPRQPARIPSVNNS